MKDEKKKAENGKFYTVVKTIGKEVKRIKKTENELTEEDVIYFYRLIAEAYNSAPFAAQLTFMSNAVPAYMQAVDALSRGNQFDEQEHNILGGPSAEA